MLLFSNTVGKDSNGIAVHSGDIVSDLKANNPNKYSSISDTEVAKLLDPELNDLYSDFEVQLDRAIANDPNYALSDKALIMSGKVPDPQDSTKQIRVTDDTLWDRASGNLAENAPDNVRIIAPFADNNSILMQTEVPRLVDSSQDRIINGIEQAELKANFDAGEFDTLNKKVTHSSFGITSILVQSTDGVDGATLLSSDIRLSAQIDEIADFKVFSKSTLSKMGTAGDILAVGILSASVNQLLSASDAAAASGDPVLAQQLRDEAVIETADFMADFGVSTAAAGFLGAAFAAAGAPVAVVLGVGFVAAYAAEQVDFYEIAAALGVPPETLDSIREGFHSAVEPFIDEFAEIAEGILGSDIISDIASAVDDATSSIAQWIDYAVPEIGDLLLELTNGLKSALSWGDPHLVTFDGLNYDFQAPDSEGVCNKLLTLKAANDSEPVIQFKMVA